ncbi:MAG: response regulator [Actinomycetota bacterium]|nr:response regulator [Actinomycetota bacterium]
MLVLIADDDATARQVLKTRIEQLDHDTALASDGTEAWDRFKTSHPDVVVTDWTMPYLNGIELCRMIREHDQDEYTYVIAVTALRNHSYALEAMRAGVDDYLTKPVDPNDLELRLLAAKRLKASYATMRTKQTQSGLRAAEPEADHDGPDRREGAERTDNRRRVLIADDDPIARATFSALVDADPALMLVGAVEDAKQAVELARAELPDIALLDWIMPGGGIRAATQIHQLSPATSIIGMSASDEPSASFDMLRAGARGFLQKGTPADEILRTLHEIGR